MTALHWGSLNLLDLDVSFSFRYNRRNETEGVDARWITSVL